MDKQKFQLFRNYELPADRLEAFRQTRDGALVGATIAKRKGWEVGQQVDLRSQLGLMFTVSGVFFTGNEEQDNTIVADIEYVQDTLDGRGRANTFFVKLKEGADAEAVAEKIDAMPLPTRTATQAEKAFVSAMIEDLSGMMSLAGLVILVTLAVVFVSVANTVSMTVRDRTRQIGVMRTLGFKRRSVLLLIVCESAFVALLGGALGAAASWAVFHLQEITVQTRTFNFAVSLDPQVVLKAVGIAMCIGVIGGLIPAFRASRMNIVRSLGTTD